MNVLVMSNLPHTSVGGAEVYNCLIYELFQNINFIEMPFLTNYENTRSLYKNVLINTKIKKILDDEIGDSKILNIVSKCNIRILKRLAMFLNKKICSKHITKEIEKILIEQKIEIILWATSNYFSKKLIRCNNNKIYFIQHQNPYHYFPLYYFDFDKTNKYKRMNLLSIFTCIMTFNYFKHIKNIICFDYENVNLINKFYKNKNLIPINIPSKFDIFSKRNMEKIYYDFIIPIRLEKQKNIDDIILFANLFPNKKFFICGEGSLKHLLKNIKNIYLSSPLDDEKLKIQYMKSKFLILFSYFEGFPLVIAEALSLGLPCIVANTFPSAKYLIGENCNRGFLFDLNDSEKFNKIINFIECCDYNQLSLNAMKFSKANLTKKQFKMNWEKIFERNI